jgi:hypothetical protein
MDAQQLPEDIRGWLVHDYWKLPASELWEMGYRKCGKWPTDLIRGSIGNMTGVNIFSNELVAKRLELLRELVRVAHGVLNILMAEPSL